MIYTNLLLNKTHDSMSIGAQEDVRRNHGTLHLSELIHLFISSYDVKPLQKYLLKVSELKHVENKIINGKYMAHHIL